MRQPRIIVTGLVGLYPVGGVAWDYLQYLVGLARLGYDAYYYEDTWTWPYHPVERQNTAEADYSAGFISNFLERYAPDLRHRWHYLHLHETAYGMSSEAFKEVARSADVFLNVSGSCMIPDDLSPGCVKVFLDTDPGYNQIMLSERLEWSENVDRWCASVREHDQHFTYAENIDSRDCKIPRLDFDWKTTRMPVVLDLWEPFSETTPPAGLPWTTVMTWNAFKGKLLYQGTEYRSKGHEFEKIITLPGKIQAPLTVAVGGEEAPLQRLASHGWKAVDGPEVTLRPDHYQTFIADSRGEVSVAKHVYVAMCTGWFSCRSACYLAAGRPVVVQETGFSKLLPTGKGLIPFSTLDDAACAIREVEADYDCHAGAAKAVAEEYFGSKIVLNDLLQKVRESPVDKRVVGNKCLLYQSRAINGLLGDN